MLVRVDVREDVVDFHVTPEARDRSVARRVELVGSTARFETSAGDPHPDVLALCATLLVAPWARSITLDRAVSQTLATAVRDGLGIAVGPVDPDLSPRERPVDGRPGLAYSGGADCTAALLVLPDETVAYFLERVTPPGQPWVGAYDKSAALHACARLAEQGRTVRTVRSDMEFLRRPHGFPHDLANAIPAILNAEADGLDAIAWGAILESTYGLGSQRFRRYEESPFVAGFGPAFAAVGLPVLNPVAGVSEVGTAIIVRRSPLADVAQSCMRGTVGRPCRRCWKCMRKVLLDAALGGEWPDERETRRMLTAKNAVTYLRKEPLKHEGVVAYVAARYPGQDDDDLMRALADRVGGYEVDWLARWYGPALELVPDEYREVTAARLGWYLEPMTSLEEQQVTTWDLRPVLASTERTRATARFMELLDDAAGPEADAAGTTPTGPDRVPGSVAGRAVRAARRVLARRRR